MKKSVNNYNTSKFYFDPQKKGELERLEKEGMFDFDEYTFSKHSLCTWIALMYDPKSELRKEVKEYPERKAVAADIAGFNRNNEGKFAKKLEHFFVGGNKRFNESIVQYLAKTNDLEYMTKCVKEHAYVKLLVDGLLNFDGKLQSLTKDMLLEIKEYEKSLFGGEEVKKMREAMYSSGEAVRSSLRREELVKMTDEEIRKRTSQYGEDYKEGDITFHGDEI